MRVLILYTELAGYVIGNINRFLKTKPDANILLLHYPVNAEAPFQIKAFPGSEFIEYKGSVSKDLKGKILNFNADVVLCSGWSNKDYLRIIRFLPFKIKKVVCFDNQWKGTIKQRILAAFSHFYLLKLFQFAWVPGGPQKLYAIKLGFKHDNIFTGLYPADTDLFSILGKRKLAMDGNYPKVILSIARYIHQKDLPTLWQAFLAANKKTGNQWILNCIGLGEQFDQRVQSPDIHHLGFKQPSEMEQYILQAGVFVLPSRIEPWGVAVHEMALSALPLVLSDQVGAASMFLDESNGFSFKAGDVQALENIFIRIMQMPEHELRKMADNSFMKGNNLLSDDWSKTLVKIYNA